MFFFESYLFSRRFEFYSFLVKNNAKKYYTKFVVRSIRFAMLGILKNQHYQ